MVYSKPDFFHAAVSTVDFHSVRIRAFVLSTIVEPLIEDVARISRISI